MHLDYLQVPRYSADSVVGDIPQTITQDYFVDVMVTGSSQPETDRQGIDFRVHMHIPWNAPKSIVTFNSPGMYVLDTTYVPDVLGLRTHFPGAETVKVLHGRAEESVQVLFPDDKVTGRGFHDVTLVDMASAVEHVVPVGDLRIMRCQWPILVVSGMTRK